MANKQVTFNMQNPMNLCVSLFINYPSRNDKNRDFK